MLQTKIFLTQMGKIRCKGLGRNTLQGIVLETAAGIGGGDNTLFHAHDPFLIQNGTSLAVSAAWLNIFFKQHGDHSDLSHFL
jgi:hypothetical protein